MAGLKMDGLKMAGLKMEGLIGSRAYRCWCLFDRWLSRYMAWMSRRVGGCADRLLG
jgi:hypothetical protein